MLRQPALFFMHVRGTLLGPTLTQDETDGCNAILTAMEGSPLAYAAYALATAYHETAHTMQPVKEFGGTAYFTRMYDIQGRNPALASRLGNTQPGDGVRYCGRGYVQLTGRGNYALASKELSFDLVTYPELALRPDIAAKVMRSGMDAGWFTGHGFDAYLTETGEAEFGEFVDARHIINGIDRAELIAGYARDFQAALQEGSWA